MNTPVSVITCPKCGRQHGLFWYVGKGKRQLSYRCDKAERTGHAKHTGSPIPVRTTATLVAPAGIVPADGLPEELTAAVVDDLQDKAQLQLPMSRVKE